MGAMESMASTTITASESLRAELVRLAARLQMNRGGKVDYEDVIQYLIDKNRRNARLLMESFAPVAVSIDEFRNELREERAEDRRREKREIRGLST